MFNGAYDSACRKEVERYYDLAVDAVESSAETDAELNASYQAILDKQIEYGI